MSMNRQTRNFYKRRIVGAMVRYASGKENAKDAVQLSKIAHVPDFNGRLTARLVREAATQGFVKIGGDFDGFYVINGDSDKFAAVSLISRRIRDFKKWRKHILSNTSGEIDGRGDSKRADTERRPECVHSFATGILSAEGSAQEHGLCESPVTEVFTNDGCSADVSEQFET